MPDQRKPVGNHLLQFLIHGSFGLLAACIPTWTLSSLPYDRRSKKNFQLPGTFGMMLAFFSGGTFLLSLIKKPSLRSSPPVWHLPEKEPCCL